MVPEEESRSDFKSLFRKVFVLGRSKSAPMSVLMPAIFEQEFRLLQHGLDSIIC